MKEYIEFTFEYTEANAPLFFGYVQSGRVTYTLQSQKRHQAISNRPGYMFVGDLPGERCVCTPPVGVSVSTIGIGIDPWLLKTWVAEEAPVILLLTAIRQGENPDATLERLKGISVSAQNL